MSEKRDGPGSSELQSSPYGATFTQGDVLSACARYFCGLDGGKVGAHDREEYGKVLKEFRLKLGPEYHTRRGFAGLVSEIGGDDVHLSPKTVNNIEHGIIAQSVPMSRAIWKTLYEVAKQDEPYTLKEGIALIREFRDYPVPVGWRQPLVGQYLRQLRDSYGVGIREFASWFGIPYSSLSHYETGYSEVGSKNGPRIAAGLEKLRERTNRSQLKGDK